MRRSYVNESSLMASQATGVESCKYPGCTRSRYIERTSSGRNFRVHDFCGRTHAELYRRWMSTSLPAPTIQRRSWTTSTAVPAATAGGRQPMKATQEYRLHTTAAGGASKDSRGYGLASTHHTGLTRSNSLPRNYRPRGSTHSHDASEIKFYDRYDPYYEFTNFYYAPITIDGKMWPTTEHYFQAQKFIGTPYVEKIRSFSAPREAFQYSRSPTVHRWQRSDWQEVKEDIMLKALRCKFDQHTNLRRLLVETRGKKLIEHTSNDSYWGDGGDGRGRNRLGELLMEVRRELQEQDGNPPAPSPEHSSLFRHPLGAFSGHQDPPSESSHRLRTSRQRSTSMSRLTDITSELSSHHPVTPRPQQSSARYTVEEAEDRPGSKSGPGLGLMASALEFGSKRASFLRRRSTSMSDLSRPQSKPAHTGTDMRSKHSLGSGSPLQPRPLPPQPRPLPLQPRLPLTPGARRCTHSPITHKPWY